MASDDSNVIVDDKGKNLANPISVVIPNSSTLGEKPEKFNQTYFKRCQQKILFYLTTLSLTKFLKEDPPTSGSSVETVAWHHSDF